MPLIDVNKRDIELNPRQIRDKGLVPATIYGSGMESVSIQLDAKEFMTSYKKDKNAIFDLKMGKETYSAIVKQVQAEAVSGKVLNVEFQQINKDKKVRVVVPVETVGDSPAVKAGGNLVLNISALEVECLPADIPSTIKVDISVLANFGQTLALKQIQFPETVIPTGSMENIVVKINTPRAAKAK